MHFEEYADIVPQILLFLLAIVVIIQLNQPLGAYEPAEETVDVTEVMETYWEPIETETVVETETETEETEETEITEEDFYDSLEMLAYCTMAEAGNQSEEGKRLVIDTILNRVDNEYFPNTVEEVINAPGQFEVVARGTLYRTAPTDDIYDLIREEIAERTNDKVIYFTAGGYNPSGEPWKKVGDHYFSYIANRYQ